MSFRRQKFYDGTDSQTAVNIQSPDKGDLSLSIFKLKLYQLCYLLRRIGGVEIKPHVFSDLETEWKCPRRFAPAPS